MVLLPSTEKWTIGYQMLVSVSSFGRDFFFYGMKYWLNIWTAILRIFVGHCVHFSAQLLDQKFH